MVCSVIKLEFQYNLSVFPSCFCVVPSQCSPEFFMLSSGDYRPQRQHHWLQLDLPQDLGDSSDPFLRRARESAHLKHLGRRLTTAWCGLAIETVTVDNASADSSTPEKPQKAGRQQKPDATLSIRRNLGGSFLWCPSCCLLRCRLLVWQEQCP